MSKIAIVTDSTAAIPREFKRGLDIEVIPLQLIWGDTTYRDGVDITPGDFFKKLAESRIHPTSSQPSPAAFHAVYQKLANEGYEILSAHISSLLSGTIDSAQQAKAMLPKAKIAIHDSLTTSICLGQQVLAAARAAREGASLAECEAMAIKARENSGVLFAVRTLEYLRRGGRIGSAAAFFGTALNLKPILEIRGGKVEAIEKVRTWGKGLDRLKELYVERIGKRSPVRICILHGGVEEEAQAVLEEVRALFPAQDVTEAVVEYVSPVVGVHAGPGVIGLAFLAGM